MVFSPVLAARRFGAGLSPHIAPPTSIEAVLDGLSAPDRLAADHPISAFDTYRELSVRSRDLRRVATRNRGTELGEVARKDARAVTDEARALAQLDNRAFVGRFLDSHFGMRERLSLFWTDHFTTSVKSRVHQYAGLAYADQAIRPHLTGSFAQMLIDVTKHPRMLVFLNQNSSVGENSPFGKGGRKKRGLNENLAREILELHTLGVDGGYSQEDVRSFAKLLTGLTVNKAGAFEFHERRSEPGTHQVLGKSYGLRTPGLAEIEEALNDIARHPDTARHLAWKLAVHFVSETPDPDLVETMAAAYLRSDTQLIPVYEAMLRHPSAWQMQDLGNVKWPQEYVLSAARALGLSGADVMDLSDGRFRNAFQGRVARMGQRIDRAPGPDGWEEADNHWITPQSVAQRITWAMQEPSKLVDELPDPRVFVTTALGDDAPEAVRFVARAAETKIEGVGLVLVSPAFQRR